MVQETIEKQRDILRATVELVLPDFDWNHCWRETQAKPEPPSPEPSLQVFEIVREIHSGSPGFNKASLISLFLALVVLLFAAS